MAFQVQYASPGSLVWEAANQGNLDLLKHALAQPGVDIEVCDCMRRTPLVEAAKYDHPECVKELLLAGANPEHQAFLSKAIDYTTNPLIKEMLRQASEAKSCGKKWIPSECFADLQKDIPVPDNNTKDNKGKKKKKNKVLVNCSQVGVPGDQTNPTSVHNNNKLEKLMCELIKPQKDLASPKPVKTASSFREDTTSITFAYASPGSLLWEAANQGNLNLLKQELARPGVDVEVCDNMQRTPLVEAAKYDHPECVKELLLAGADPDHEAFLGKAIDYASNPLIQDMLTQASEAKAHGEKWMPRDSSEDFSTGLQKGSCDVAKDSENKKKARKTSQLDVTNYQQVHLPSVWIPWNFGNTKDALGREDTTSITFVYSSPGSLLWEAANQGNLSLLRQELAKPGVVIEVCDNMQRTPLVEAVKYGHPECVKELLLAGANPDHEAFMGKAIEYASNPLIKEMLRQASGAKARGHKWVPGDVFNTSQCHELVCSRDGTQNSEVASATNEGRGKEKRAQEHGHIEDVTNRVQFSRTCRYFRKGQCRLGDACRYKH